MYELAIAQPPVRVFLTFRASGRLYGLEGSHVREVSTHMEFTPVPQAPPFVRGLANLRSRIHLVIDAGIALGGAPSVCKAESRLIVLHERVAESLGLLVDCGGDIVKVPVGQIEDAAQAEAAESPVKPASSPVVAVCKLEGELLMVIDPSRVVAALEAAIHCRAVGSETGAANVGKAEL